MKIEREFKYYDKWIRVEDALPEDFDDICEYDGYLVAVNNKTKYPGQIISIARRSHDEGWEILGNAGSFCDTGFWEIKSEDITHWKYLDEVNNISHSNVYTKEELKKGN